MRHSVIGGCDGAGMSIFDGKRKREQQRQAFEAYRAEMCRLDRAFALGLAAHLTGDQRAAALKRIDETWPNVRNERPEDEVKP